jgi:hypothetical protein
LFSVYLYLKNCHIPFFHKRQHLKALFFGPKPQFLKAQGWHNKTEPFDSLKDFIINFFFLLQGFGFRVNERISGIFCMLVRVM